MELKSSLTIGLPYPISATNVTQLRPDPCIELVKEKSKYQAKLTAYLQEHKKYKDDINEKELENVTKLKIPNYLLDLCLGKLKNPDAYFEGDYNWYYTGGSLQTIQIGSVTYLVRPVSSSKLCFTNISDFNSNTFTNDNEEEICALYSLYNNETNYLYSRCKFSAKLFECIFNNDDISLVSKWSYDTTDVPIIDFRVNEFNVEDVAILNLDRKLEIHNLRTNKQISYQIEDTLNEELHDRLMQCIYTSNKTLSVMDRCSLYDVDTKSKDVPQYKLKQGYFICDDLCCLVLSKINDNYIYCASVHNILKIDRRQQTIIKKWPHFLSQPPTAINIAVMDDGNECVLVSSQKYNDKSILIANPLENNVCRFLSNNLDTLKLVNLNEYIINEDITKRLFMSTAGIQILSNSDGCTLFSSNAIGDLFVNTMGTCENLAPAKLTKWIKSLPKRKKPLQVTGLREMSDARTSLLQMKNPSKVRNILEENLKIPKLLEKLNMDIFPMGDIWDADNEIDSISSSLDPAMTTNYKVSNWLNTINDND